MVAMGVGEGNAGNGTGTELCRAGKDGLGAAGDGGVDQCVAVGLADEIAVEQSQTGELVGLRPKGDNLHAGAFSCVPGHLDAARERSASIWHKWVGV